MLKDLSLTQYAEILSSDSPTPGGGSSLAVVLLNAVSLVAMSMNVTATKYAKKQLDVSMQNQLLPTLYGLSEICTCTIDQDGKAFATILDAMRMPKSTPEEISVRQIALQNAYTDSAKLCLRLMETAVKTVDVADQAILLADKFVVSDAYIGKELAKTVGICCRHNVEVNADCISDDNERSEIIAKMNVLLDYLQK